MVLWLELAGSIPALPKCFSLLGYEVRGKIWELTNSNCVASVHSDRNKINLRRYQALITTVWEKI